MSRHALIVWSSLLLVAAPAAAQQPDRKAKVDALVRPLLEAKLVVGLTVGLIDARGREVHGYGKLGGKLEGKPDGRTVYEIGSISKVFTGTLLADMVERKLIKLSDPAGTLLPKEVKLPSGKERPISLLDLATHTSGLPRMPSNFRPADRRNPYADYTVAQMYAFLGRCKLLTPPGKQFLYSNLGVGLLGHALALKAGKSYEALMTERICEPLGMTDTSIRLSEDQRKRLAAPYDGGGNPVRTWDIVTLAGAGGIRSTTDDMLRFLAANLGLTESPLAAAMLAARKKRFEIRAGRAVGLNWFHTPDGETIWHNGQTGGYHCFAGFDPRRKIGVVVLCNTAVGHVDQLGVRLLRLLAGKPYKPVQFRKTISLPPKQLEEYVGTYRLAPTFALTVTRRGNQLLIQATNQEKYPVFAAAKDRFFYRIVKAEVVFERDGAGKIYRLVLHQNGRKLPGLRDK